MAHPSKISAEQSAAFREIARELVQTDRWNRKNGKTRILPAPSAELWRRPTCLGAKTAWMVSNDIRNRPPGDMRKGPPVEPSVTAACNPW